MIRTNTIVFKHLQWHIMVYCNGKFLFSADNTEEAQNELEQSEEEQSKIA